jgi:hypothetical protein
MRKKSLLRRLIPWMIAAVLIALLVIFVGIPLYGQQEEEVNDPPTVSYFEDSGLDLTLENDYLSFVMDPSTTQFTLTEKETGRVWNSNPADAAQDKVALSQNKDTLDSTLIVTYTTSGGEVSITPVAITIE